MLKRDPSYKRVLDRGPNGDKVQGSDLRKLECGHSVPHAATISYDQETGRVTCDRYVWCRECEENEK